MYRSGDRGRLLPGGQLEHLGRLDNQVKLRGFRIELDEIRARLLDAPSVGAAAVVLRDDRDAAAARLDGYVVFHGGDGDVEEVHAHAARFLPEYMVPSTVTALPALPLTPNGKVDVEATAGAARRPPAPSVHHGRDAPGRPAERRVGERVRLPCRRPREARRDDLGRALLAEQLATHARSRTVRRAASSAASASSADAAAACRKAT